MKITVVAPRFPYPLDRGDRLTIYHLLKYFAQRHQVSLVCFTKPEQDPSWIQQIRPFCERVELIPLRTWRAVTNSALGFFSTTPLQVNYHRDPAMRRAVHRVIEETEPDLLYGHYIRMGGYVEPYRHLPRVLAMQLSMTLNYRRLAEHPVTPLHKLVYGLEYRRLRRFEAAFARRFDKVLLISAKDLEAINPNPPLDNVFFSPHGVDFDFFQPDGAIQRAEKTLVFTGNMKYMPNVDAALYFCHEILPLVRERVPDVQLNIVGTNPLPEVQALGQLAGVTVTGRVPDLRTYMNRAAVAVAPMRITAGLLNKVLEALSMKLPMVVTPQANEGIRAVDGNHLLVAHNPRDFANKVVHLLESPQRRAELGEAGRAFILREWSWEKHFTDLEEMFIELVEEFSSRSAWISRQAGERLSAEAVAGD